MSGWSVGPVGQRLSIDGGFGGPMAPTDLTRVISGVAGWGRAETGGEDPTPTPAQPAHALSWMGLIQCPS